MPWLEWLSRLPWLLLQLFHKSTFFLHNPLVPPRISRCTYKLDPPEKTITSYKTLISAEPALAALAHHSPQVENLQMPHSIQFFPFFSYFHSLISFPSQPNANSSFPFLLFLLCLFFLDISWLLLSSILLHSPCSWLFLAFSGFFSLLLLGGFSSVAFVLSFAAALCRNATTLRQSQTCLVETFPLISEASIYFISVCAVGGRIFGSGSASLARTVLPLFLGPLHRHNVHTCQSNLTRVSFTSKCTNSAQQVHKPCASRCYNENLAFLSRKSGHVRSGA